MINIKLHQNIKIGMTTNEVINILGEPSDRSQCDNPLTLVFGNCQNGGLNGDFLEITFYQGKLCMVMQMPQHKTLLK